MIWIAIFSFIGITTISLSLVLGLAHWEKRRAAKEWEAMIQRLEASAQADIRRARENLRKFKL